MSIAALMAEQGYTTESTRDWAVRKLAEWEDRMSRGDGSFPMDIEDELAMVRHYIMHESAPL